MRFKRAERFAFTDTARKRAHVLISQRKAREKLPLFGPLIAEEQPAVDKVMSARADHWISRQIEQRMRRAADWRKARARLNRLPEPGRTAFLHYWNAHRWFPADPSYLETVLLMFEDGRLILIDGHIEMAFEVKWRRERDDRISAMTDADLDRLIQGHISLQFVELGRAERQRRQEMAMA